MKQTAADVAAAVTARLRGKKRKLSAAKDDPPQQVPKRRKLHEEDLEYIQISSESDCDCDDTESTLSLEESTSSQRTRSAKKDSQYGLVEGYGCITI